MAMEIAMFRREDARFPVEGGIDLSAWLFVPEHQTARLPAITMAHGFAGTKYHGIEPMAQGSGCAATGKERQIDAKRRVTTPARWMASGTEAQSPRIELQSTPTLWTGWFLFKAIAFSCNK
jgi:hypothetical protein